MGGLSPSTTSDLVVARTSGDTIAVWREMYRSEMNCQIVHDSIHSRRGWTDEYLLSIAGTPVGYGSVAVGGPWSDQPAAYELYVVPEHRLRLLDLCRAFLSACDAINVEVQSNDPLAVVMLHSFVPNTTCEAILFHDKVTTWYVVPGASFRQATASEAPDVALDQRRWRGVVELDGKAAASGGVLFHYNRPYGDIYMEVAEPYRRRGLGSFIVQELKRLCYEGGHVPAARCSPSNVASQRTLQKAGFVPCGHILKGRVALA